MKIEKLPLDGLLLIKSDVFSDNRGFIEEAYRETFFKDNGIDIAFVQDNHSYSKKGVIRGMHYQKGEGQDKLVSCLSGEIFDVVVDMRKDSSTYKKWYGIKLNDKNCYKLFIPKGFAHGFSILSEGAHVYYKISTYFDPVLETGFKYDDIDIGIEWPVQNPILSEKDKKAPPFAKREM